MHRPRVRLSVGPRMLLLLLVLPVVSVGAPMQSRESPHPPTYDITVRIMPDQSRLEVSGRMTLAAAAATDTLRFRLDARITAVSLTVAAPVALTGATTVSRAGDVSTVMLPGTLAAGTPLVLRFAYTVGSGWTRSFYAGPDGAFISGEAYNWYPMPVGGRRGTGRLRFIAPAGFTVAATGRRLANDSDDGVFAFDVTDATTFSFAAGRHHVHRAEGKPAIALHLLRDRPRITERLAQLRSIVSALETEFGAFPHPDLEIVEMSAAAAGGSHAGVSLEGFVVAGESQMDSFNFAFLAHEIGHQWWADCVFATGSGNTLLTEAMAQYAALRAAEAVHGADAAREFRWSGYPGASIFDSGRGYVSLLMSGIDAPLAAGSVPQHLPYSKGFLVHDLLARTVGRDRFREFMHGFIRKYKFQDVTWPDFVASLTATFGDLRWFVEQWYERPGLPEWTLSWRQQDGRLYGTITQRTPYYRAEIEVLVERSGPPLRRHVRVEGPRTEFVWPARFPVSSVTLDPDYETPHLTAQRRAEADVVVPLARAVRLTREGGSDFLHAVRAVYAELPEAEAPRHRFVLNAVECHEAYRRGDNDAARVHLERALASPFRLRSALPEMYYIRAVLAQTSGNRALLEDSARAAVAADRALNAPSGWGSAAQDLLAGPR